MRSSTQAFLEHILDYAGMFPPAKLPLHLALHRYLDYRTSSPHAWMLERFVCPASRLHEIMLEDLSPQKAVLLKVTALGQQANDEEHLCSVLDDDLHAIESFRHVCGGAVIVDSLELALPRDIPAMEIGNHVDGIQLRMEEHNLRGFLELPRDDSWRWCLAELSLTLGQETVLGLKLRCGGVTADTFPSAEDMAHFIACCARTQTPWKATAGLHHPRPFWDAHLNLWHHGFLNVFAAGILAQCHPLQEIDLVEILTDRELRQLRFDEDGLTWKNWSCPVAKIADIRRQSVLSFGSCSFEEPVQDLLALGLI